MPGFSMWSPKALRIGGTALVVAGAVLIAVGSVWLIRSDSGTPEGVLTDPTQPASQSTAVSDPPRQSADDAIRALFDEESSTGLASGHDPSTRTGNPAVDTVIEALVADDSESLLTLLEGMRCVRERAVGNACEGRGFESPDSPVFGVYSCAEAHLGRSDFKDLASTLAVQESRVRAVLGPVDGPSNGMEHGVLVDGDSRDWLATVDAEGGVSAVDLGCDGESSQASRWTGASFLLSPPDPDRPTATPAATQTPYPPPLPIGGLAPVEIELGEDADLPDDLLLYYNVTCYGCDGSASALSRAYRDSSGQLETKRLFDGIPRSGTTYVHSYALEESGYEIVAAICTVGHCGGIRAASADAEIRLFRSRDGGVSWEDSGELPPESFTMAVSDGEVVVTTWNGLSESGSAFRHWLYPSGRDLEPPEGAVEAHPLMVSGLGLVWSTEEEGRTVHVDQSGEQLYDDIDPRLTTFPQWLSSGGRLLVFGRDPSELPRRTYVATLGQDRKVETVHYWEGSSLAIHQAITPTLLLGSIFADESRGSPTSAATGYRAVLIDLETGVAHSIRDLPSGRVPAFAEFTVPGPFGRVTADGDCRSVRAEPSEDAFVLDCLHDDTLLRYQEIEKEAEGRTWVVVRTPAGNPGWIPGEFFVR